MLAETQLDECCRGALFRASTQADCFTACADCKLVVGTHGGSALTVGFIPPIDQDYIPLVQCARIPAGAEKKVESHWAGTVCRELPQSHVESSGESKLLIPSQVSLITTELRPHTAGQSWMLQGSRCTTQTDQIGCVFKVRSSLGLALLLEPFAAVIFLGFSARQVQCACGCCLLHPFSICQF